MINKNKILNIFRIQLQVIDEEIYDALKKDDIQRLKGIQSFASSLWNWTNVGVVILSYLMRRTIEKRKEKAKEEFSLAEIIDMTKNLNTTEFFLEGFEKSGYIKMVDNNPKGYKGEKDGIKISLTPIWKTSLRRLESKGKETEVFSQSIGALLSLSVLAKQEGKPCGVRLFTAFSNMCDLAGNNMNDKNKVSLDDCKALFAKEGRTIGRFYQALSEDNQKVDALRFISKNDGKNIVVSTNAINFHRRISKRANDRIMEMYRK